MKKFFTLILALIIVSVSGFGQVEDYSKAMSKENSKDRIAALEAYLTKYPTSEYHKYVFAQLAVDYVEMGEYQKAFENALKAEGFINELNLTEQSIAGLYLVLGAYYLTKNNNQEAISYADKVIQLSQGKTGEAWRKLSESARRIKNTVGVSPLSKAIALYNQKNYPTAEKELFEIYKNNKNNLEIVTWYAKALEKNKKIEQALEVFKEAYKLKKDGMIAYNIGIILARKSETNKSLVYEAINYFLEASLSLKDSRRANEALNLARGLFLTNYKDKESGLDYNSIVKQIQEENNKINQATEQYNKKYVGKEEEEVDKKQMEKDLKIIEALRKELKNLEDKTKKAVDEFNKLFEAAKARIK